MRVVLHNGDSSICCSMRGDFECAGWGEGIERWLRWLRWLCWPRWMCSVHWVRWMAWRRCPSGAHCAHGSALGRMHVFFAQTSNTNNMRQFSLIRTNMFIPYIRPNTLCIAMPFVVSCEIARWNRGVNVQAWKMDKFSKPCFAGGNSTSVVCVCGTSEEM